MTTDEQRVLWLVAERLELGRARYGPLRLDTDPRDFETEALEEALDLAIYLAARLLQLQRERAEAGGGQ